MNIEIRSPQPYDLVGGAAVGREHVPVCFAFLGSGTRLTVIVRDEHGTELATTEVHAAGSGELGGHYAFEVSLPEVPATKYGAVEFAPLHGAPPEHVVPVIFGSVIMPGYFTFARHTVVGGDTLWGIAEAEYKRGSEWGFIYEANSHQISDPNRIYRGQLLNVPHSVETVFHR